MGVDATALPLVATTRAMNDTEKSAIWAYLHSIEPRPEGER